MADPYTIGDLVDAKLFWWGFNTLVGGLGILLLTPAKEETTRGRRKGETRFGFACRKAGFALGRGIRKWWSKGY